MRRVRAKCRLALALLAACAVSAAAAAQEPRVPPGLSPPGAVGVALLGPGVDYRRPELADHFARDGEGVLISWDFTDNDPAPFAEAGPGTPAALTLSALAPAARLVIVKQRPGDAQAFGHMMTFVARTPTRIVVWLEADPKRPDWPILAEAVRRFGDRLFVLPAGDGGRDLDRAPAYQSIRGAANVVIATSDAASANRGRATIDVTVVGTTGSVPLTSGDATLVVAALAARALAAQPTRSMAGLKQAIVKQGRLTVDAANAAFGGKQ